MAMSETPELTALRAAEHALLQRWPETKLDPSLERIAAMCDLLGQPQRAYPVVHLTGTNGKTSTARMVDSLLRGLGLRTGQFTSPHLESITERISIDGHPLSPQRFAEVYAEVAPYAQVVDNSGDYPVSFFEFVTAMAFAAFADAPVADASVAVITPVGVDHSRYLGETPEAIAVEKAGILKAGSFGILAQQSIEVAEVLLQRAAEVGATVAREGLEFGVVERIPGMGGQMLTLQGLGGTYEEIFLPLYGAHQAQNAVCALAAVEAFAGGKGLDGGLDVEAVREAFAQVTSPARLEIIRRSPTIVLDAAHNPHGAAALVEAVQESFAFSPLVGVVGTMEDKDVAGLIDAFEPLMASIVCTQNSTARAMPADELAEVARGVFGSERVEVAPRLDDALDIAVGLAESADADAINMGRGGVLVTGSVITAGEARRLLRGDQR